MGPFIRIYLQLAREAKPQHLVILHSDAVSEDTKSDSDLQKWIGLNHNTCTFIAFSAILKRQIITSVWQVTQFKVAKYLIRNIF